MIGAFRISKAGCCRLWRVGDTFDLLNVCHESVEFWDTSIYRIFIWFTAAVLTWCIVISHSCSWSTDFKKIESYLSHLQVISRIRIGRQLLTRTSISPESHETEGDGCVSFHQQLLTSLRLVIKLEKRSRLISRVLTVNTSDTLCCSTQLGVRTKRRVHSDGERGYTSFRALLVMTAWPTPSRLV